MSLFTTYNTLQQKQADIFEKLTLKQVSLESFYRIIEAKAWEVFFKDFTNQQILQNLYENYNIFASTHIKKVHNVFEVLHDLSFFQLKEEFKLYLIKDAIDFFDEQGEGEPHIKINQTNVENYSDLLIYNSKYSDILHKLAVCEILLSHSLNHISTADLEDVEKILLTNIVMKKSLPIIEDNPQALVDLIIKNNLFSD